MPRILIVDDDLLARAAIVSQLARPHREIATAENGREALALARTFAPNLIVTDIVMPGLDGWELVGRLRAERETALTPVIFLTGLSSPAARVYGLRLGAVDFLGKPVDLDELELRVENALHYSARAQRLVDVVLADGLAGSLEHVALPSLLNMLALDRKSGELRLAQGGEEATLLLRDGAVVSASFARRPAPSGARCIYELLRWEVGRFAFAERPVLVADEVGMSTTSLLMEAARLLDELGSGRREAS